MAASKPKMVTAVFRDRTSAQAAFDWLRAKGYSADEVNVLMSDTTRAKYFPVAKEGELGAKSHAAEGMGIGGAVGTAVGASLAALAAIGTSIALPGLGLVVAGPIAAALAGAGAGAVTGGLLGGLIGLGLPEPNAKAYEEALREGGVVIGVVPHDQETTEIRKYFENHHGESVYYG
jgi:hypothetical protein